jgi:hypothetical protein
MKCRIAAVGLIAVLLTACNTEADRQKQAALTAEQLLAKQKAAAAAERLNVVRNPNDYLKTSDFKSLDRGIINSYRELTSVTVLNTSKYPLNNLSGEVDWLAEDGSKFGSVPFTLKGSIPAGDTKEFSTEAHTLVSNTVKGNAKRLRVRFTNVEIVGTP